MPITKHEIIKLIFYILSAVFFIYLLLLIPGGQPQIKNTLEAKPFEWNQDSLWVELQARFSEIRKTKCDQLFYLMHKGMSEFEVLLNDIEGPNLISPGAPVFDKIEQKLFETAPIFGVCPEEAHIYIRNFNRLRYLLKKQSQGWDMNSTEARHQVYRLLYGGRMAVEEIILQDPSDKYDILLTGSRDAASDTPSKIIHGVRVHSGDILVSRGGAPTSALIARGNDYPGNFSHVALVHIDDSDENNGSVSIIEAHIEQGVAISSVDQYLKDIKFRIMILRLRSDHPVLLRDPMMPHKAATAALKRAKTEHIPYDFEMDYKNHDKLFCSEVASAEYKTLGVTIWKGLSTISSPGITSWLAAFGVRHFQTQEPSDLEYDPQLTIVAEWRDTATLFKDHVDNAVTDTMLEGANAGDPLKYRWYLLPVARLLKGWSLIKNYFNGIGPIPEGMSARAALQNDWYSKRHSYLAGKVLEKSEQFKSDYGYSPPYWELVKMAGEAKKQADR